MPQIPVLDSYMHYHDQGHGTPVVLLHGNPVSSHLWRNVIPPLAQVTRCLAPDLIGMGKSGKPPVNYTFHTQARYLDAWIEAMNLDQVILVGIDWGGALALDWAARHEGQVKGVVLLETILKPMRWSEFPEQARELFQTVRTPGVGEQLVQEDNAFLQSALTHTVLRPLALQDRTVYEAPFLTPASRLPILQWARSMPLDGEPTDVIKRIERYDAWLSHSAQTPKLLMTFSGSPTLMIGEKETAWCRAHIANLSVVACGEAGHLAPEDQPVAIAQAILKWLGDQDLAQLGAPQQAGRVVKVDYFTLPESSKAELLENVERTLRLLRQQPGFVRDQVLFQQGSEGRCHLMTLVEWQDQQAILSAREVVQNFHRGLKLNPATLYERLDIKFQGQSYSVL